ncbi:MAG: hypothetical protein H5T62_17710, partial [Anaerolineae bacterium]|nr:hypothetical protein [Anaerolineae bacterium]
MMKTSVVFTGVVLVALLTALTQCCPSCGPSTTTPTSPSSKTTTRSFEGGDVTLRGDEEQLNKIADVELVPEGDSRYPKPQDIAGDVTKILSVFEIKLKAGVASIAPPPLTIENIYVGQKGVDLKNQGLAHLPLPIYRFDPSTSAWPKAGEAKLKSDPEWASGTIEKASLLAIVSTAPVTAPTQPPLQDLEARIYESTKQIIANENPETVSVIWGSEAAPYGEVAELTRVSFEEQGVGAALEFIPDVSIVRERLAVAADAGELPDCIVLIGVSGDVDSLQEIIIEFERSLYVYNEESGYLEKRASPAALTPLSWEEVQARVYESTKLIVADEDPGAVSIFSPIIWGADAPPYDKIAEAATADFMEQGVEAQS